MAEASAVGKSARAHAGASRPARGRLAEPGGRLFTVYLLVTLALLVIPFGISYAIWLATGEWAVRTAYQDVAPVAHTAHAVFALALLLAFPVQALAGLRAARTGRLAAFHRLEGRVLVPAYVLLVATGMVILWDSSVLARGVASLSSVLQITVLITASAVSLVAAWRAARAGAIGRHMDHVLFALVALTNVSVGRLVIGAFTVAGLEPGPVTLPWGAVGFVSDGEFGAIVTMAIVVVLWITYGAARGILRSQWGKTAVVGSLPLFWPIVLLPGLGS